MSDITKCTNKSCPKRFICNRFTAPSNQYNQSYQNFEYTLDSGDVEFNTFKCEFYYPSRDLSIINDLLDEYSNISNQIAKIQEDNLEKVIDLVYKDFIENGHTIKVYKWLSMDDVQDNLLFLVDFEYLDTDWEGKDSRELALKSLLPWYMIRETNILSFPSMYENRLFKVLKK